MVLAYLRRTSGLRTTQITRLVARWDENRLATVPLAKRYRAPAVPFARKYTPADVGLLVEMDRANIDMYAAPPLLTCCNVPTPCTAIRTMNDWQACRYRTCTTCVKAPATKPSA